MPGQRWQSLSGGRRTLLVAATPSEAIAALAALGVDGPVPERWRPASAAIGPALLDVLVSGVGKSNAAAATAVTLAARPAAYGMVVNVGIAGALPAQNGAMASPGQLVVARSSVFGDEGLAAPAGFTDIAAMGFPPLAGAATASLQVGVRIDSDPAAVDALLPFAEAAGPIATVSTCSGTDAIAAEVARRTGALAEAMEGAACAVVAASLGAPFVEVRAISNTTGDRDGQRWDIPLALARLRRFLVEFSLL